MHIVLALCAHQATAGAEKVVEEIAKRDFLTRGAARQLHAFWRERPCCRMVRDQTGAAKIDTGDVGGLGSRRQVRLWHKLPIGVNT